jgi:uncharacterized protein YndB with AHSA1/START domain
VCDRPESRRSLAFRDDQEYRRGDGLGGVFLEIVAPERIVQTERFEDSWYAGEGRNTMIFVESGGKTTMTITCLYDSKEIRDSVLKSPMEGGVSTSYDRLAEMLPTFAAESRE